MYVEYILASRKQTKNQPLVQILLDLQAELKQVNLGMVVV